MLPILVQNVITNFVSLLDNIMVGQVGTEPMSGVAIVNQLIFVFNLCIFGGLAGAGIFTAQYYGKNDSKGVADTFRAKLYIAAFTSAAFIVVFLLFGEQLIMQFIHEGEEQLDMAATLNYGKDYLAVMLIQIPPFALQQVYASTLKESGETLVPMKAGIIAVLVNLVGNYILIFGKLGAPVMGVVGAAIATVISRFVECAIIIIWTHRHRDTNPFVDHAYTTWRIPETLLRQIVVMGLPLLVNELLWSSGMTVLSQCYSMRGLEVVSAVNISTTVSNLFFCAFFSMGNSIAIIIGQLLGADRIEEAKDADRKLIFFAVSTTVVIAAILAALSGAIPQIYEVSDGVRSLAAKLLLVAACTMPFDCLANACYFTIRSGGKTLVTMFFDSFYGLVFTTPLAYLLRLTTGIDIVWLYAVCRAVELGKGVVGLILIKRGYWIHNIVKDQSNEHRVLPEA